MVKAAAVERLRDPIESVGEVVPLIVPVSVWDILVIQSKIEKCSPGEVLDKALCGYLEANGGERMKALKLEMERRKGYE